MDITVGTDQVEIERVTRALRARTPRLGRRLFTPAEWDYCHSRAHPYASLSARFAAKEALRKIFGQWGYLDVNWRETEIGVTSAGAPHVQLHGACAERARGVRFTLSLAHNRTLAHAVCIAYREAQAAP